MEVHFHKKFLKDLSDLPPGYRKRIEKIVFEIFPKAKGIHSIGGVEKLRGYTNYYKIRFGNFRVGFRFEDDKVIFERVLNRKEIYRYFPVK